MRGALLSFAPFLLGFTAFSIWMLLNLIISGTLWGVSLVPLLLLAVVGYYLVLRQRHRAYLTIDQTAKTLEVCVPWLGTWKFVFDHLISFEIYTSETKRQRQKKAVVRFIGWTVVVSILCYLHAYAVLFGGVVLGITFYPLTTINKPSLTKSGVIFYFATSNHLAPIPLQLSNVHVSADDMTVEAIKQAVQPFIQFQHLKDVA